MNELIPLGELYMKFMKIVGERGDENIWLRLYPDGKYQIMSGQEPMVSFEHPVEEGHYV